MTAPDTAPDLLGAALWWAKVGENEIPVFPLYSISPDGSCNCTPAGEACRGGSPGKHPMGANGFKDATLDTRQIEQWWTPDGPDALEPNIGLATGGHFWVLDIDPKSGGVASLAALEAEHEPLPMTHRVRTGSGGWHYYFKMPEGVEVRCGTNTRPGIDWRGDGGYVVTAPSNHASGLRYEIEVPTNWQAPFPPAPSWLIDLVRVDRVRPGSNTPGSEFKPVTTEAVDPKVLADVQAALPFIPSEDRDQWLRVAMALKRGGEEYGAPETFFAMLSSWSSQSDKYDPRDTRRVWDSIDPQEGGVTLKAVYGMAQSAGWSNGTAPPPFAMPAAALEILPPIVDEPIPERLLELDGILGLLVREINEASILPRSEGALAAALTALGALYGRRYDCGGLRTNLYTVVVGDTGRGKDAGRSFIAKAFQTAGLDRLLGGSNFASGPGIWAALRERPALLFMLDEFGDILASATARNASQHKVAILRELKTLYTSADAVVRPQEYASKESREQVSSIIEPHLCILGSTTPGQFYAALDSSAVEGGLVGRLLLFQTRGEAVTLNRNARRKASPELLAMLREHDTAGKPSGNLAEAGVMSSARPVPIVDEASTRLMDYRQGIEEKDGEGRWAGAAVGSLWRRVAENATKLAMIRAISRDPHSPQITDPDAVWGLEVCRWSAATLEAKTTANVSDTKEGQLAAKILNGLRAAPCGRLSVSAITREVLRYNASARQRDEALGALVEGGSIGFEEGVSTGGRPAKVYFVRSE